MTSLNVRATVIFLLSWSAAVFVQTNPSSPQDEQSKTVLKTNTRLVIVDVVATDSKGSPVSGLESIDFTVIENGAPQKISEFSFQHPDEISGSGQQLPPNVFTNVPAKKSSSLNVILLDELNGEFTSRAHALDELVKYLDGGPAIQPTAVYVMEQNLRLLHDFTTNAKALKEVLAGYRPRVAPHMDTVYATASPFTQKGNAQSNPTNIEGTLKSLHALTQALSGYPGRKNLIWLSEAFPVNLFPDLYKMGPPDSVTGDCMGFCNQGNDSNTRFGNDRRGDYLAEVQKLADAMMAAQMAVYPIDSAGVGKISRLDSWTTMRTMAERTGGKTFANQNDLNTSIRGSMDDGSTYYTLGYYPADKNWDGKLRQIEIKTSHPGVNLRYRLGYYALDPGVESKEEAKMLAADFSRALALDTPSSTAVLFHATVTPPGSGQKLQVSFAIDPHTLSYAEKEGGAQQASLGCAIVAYTERGSRVKDEINNLVGKVKAEEFPKLMRSSFPCTCTIDLKPGKYQLRLGVVDKISTQMGTATASVTVP
ncbi:MAG TPA: VWA domain-containing protein [Candidatus Angelobacter sp.]